MKKVVGTILKIGGVAIAVAGFAYIAKLAFDDFFNEKDDIKDEGYISVEPYEYSSENDNITELDVDSARSEAAEEIKLRHQEAAMVMKEMIEEIDKEPDAVDETEKEERLNFDDIDASLDKLFEED